MWTEYLKKNRIALISIANLILLLILVLLSFIKKNPSEKSADSSLERRYTFMRGISNLTLEGKNLIALNHESVSGFISDTKNQDILFYLFTSEQKSILSQKTKSHGGAAVELSVFDDGNKKSKCRSVKFGFIRDSNLKGGGIVFPEDAMSQADFDFSESKSSEAKISICVSRDDDIAGFYVFGEDAFHIGGVQIVDARIGFDISTDVPVWAFSSNGGHADCESFSVDFYGGKKTFGTENSAAGVLPKIEIALKSSDEVPVDGEMDRVVFRYGREDFVVRRSPEKNSYTIQAAATEDRFASMDFVKNASLVESVFMSANPAELCPENGIVDTPLLTDVGLIIQWPRDSWRGRDYELFRWEQFPDVLVFDFKSYDIQTKFLGRLSFFVEKPEYKGKFVGNDFFEENRSYNAHDYKADDIARFFTEAEKQKFRLNDEEILLRKILLKNGVIVQDKNGKYGPGTGAIISISRESWTELRYQLMAHEAWHGIYFTDGDFRTFADSVYAKTNRQGIDFLKAYFETYDSLGYDTKNEYLMRNEFMAYMLQKSPERTKDYFLNISNWTTLCEKYPEQVAYIRKNDCEDFRKASEALCNYVSKRWGYWGGRTYLVSKS